MRKRLIAIAALSVLGIVVSGYSLLHHSSFVSGAFCTINSTFNCDIVNKGPFSEVGGVPVALIGVLGYVFLLVAAMLYAKRPQDRALLAFLLLASAGGFAFSLYLTYLEAFVLKAWCLLCLTSQASILGVLVLSASMLYDDRKRTTNQPGA